MIRAFVIAGAFAAGAIALAPLTAIAADASSTRTAAAPRDTLLSLQPSTIKALDGTTHSAEIGRLTVLEAHARPVGKKINFVFLRLKSRSAVTGPPIVFLPGGPGYPGTFLARTPNYLRLFERLSEHADVIVIDQRGAGLSEPSLQCATRGSFPPQAFESEPRVASALGAMVQSCVRMMRRDGYSIEAYNTAESVEDLEDLRRALGVERLRLLAGSYGTELALEMIRRHGDRIESAALAGIRGPDMTWRLPSTRDLQLHRLSTLVAADPKWARALPDLEGSVRRLIERLRWRPLWVPITDAKTGQAIRVRVGPVAIQAIVGSDVNEPDWAPMLPAMMASLAAGDSTLFVRRVEDLFNGTGSGVSIMQIATDCASGASPDRRARVAREAETAILGNVKNVFVNPAFCELVGTPELDASYRAPVASPVRTLFLTGSMDAITPPDQAEEVRSRFKNGTLLVVENGWHEVLPESDVQSVVSDFFEGRDVQPRTIRLAPLRFLTIEEAKAVTASNRE